MLPLEYAKCLKTGVSCNNVKTNSGANLKPQNHPAASIEAPHIKRLEYSIDKGMGSRARIGLMVLQTDQTIEGEFRRLLALDGVETYHSRLANEPLVTPETLQQMEAELPVAVELLPVEFGFSAIAYGCTSGSTLIGEDKVSEIIGRAHPSVPSTNPLSAAKCAMKALNVRKMALLTPYSPEVTNAMQANFIAAGLQVCVVGSFYQNDDAIVGRIDEKSIVRAAISIGKSSDCEGVFISCTSLRVANSICDIECQLGKPVTSSNHALAWHLLRLAGIDDVIEHRGQLFTQPLPK